MAGSYHTSRYAVNGHGLADGSSFGLYDYQMAFVTIKSDLVTTEFGTIPKPST
jgi:hypothetical protein